jgi:AcrR family transcriptional regulator
MDPRDTEVLLDTLLLELSSKGYAELSVDEVLALTGVSESDFERQFGEKDDALFAAYRNVCDRVVNTAMGACDEGEPWPERVRSGLKVLLDLLAAKPDMARALTRSFPGICPATYQCYADLLARFLPAMQAGRDYAGVDEELPSEVELMAVGAAEAIIFVELDAGRADRLPQMLPEILFSILVPFIGPERAAEEMHSAAAATP